MNGLTLTIPYAMCNKHPVHCYTDHTPLTWIKHTSGKGPVSQFIIDTLSVIDYEMHYIKGVENVIADTLSRFPLLGPSKLSRTGIAEATNVLLSALTGTNVDTSKLWFYTGKDTKHLIANIYDWRHGLTKDVHPKEKTHCYMDLVSVSNINKIKYTMGIWAPTADKITQQCRVAFQKGTPFACLVPNDLVHLIAVDEKYQVDQSVLSMVEKAMKLTLLSPGLTWIIHGIDFSSQKRHIQTVYAGDRVTPEFELSELLKKLRDSNPTPALPHFKTRQEWIDAQKRDLTKLRWEHDPHMHEALDGLITYHHDDGRVATIVPGEVQKELVEWQHKNLCHVGSQKIFSVLKKGFHFNMMRRQCREVTRLCPLCNLLKARARHAHKHFRAKLFCTPRTAYGADYYGVKQNKEGYNNILGIIDLSDGHLVLSAVKNRTAANTAHVVFHEIITRKGVPLLFHSDAAKEFLSTAMKALSTTLGMRQTNTLAHNPKSNAKIERVWQYVGRALQSMTPAQYSHFHSYLPILTHVWNTIPDSDTGITPFEAEHGMKCRGIAESIIQEPPKEGLPAGAADLRTITVSVNAFMEILTNIKAVEKSLAAVKLNADGTSKVHFELGDRVAFYLPPGDEVAKKMGKKNKHILQYSGPGIITKVLSPNGTSFEITYNGRHYNRNVMHLNRYRAIDEVPAALQMPIDYTVSVGSYVAVLDNTNDRHFHIAQVLDITDLTTKLHYMGTTARNLRGAKWTKLYHHPGSNRIVTQQPQNLIRNWMRFTGEIETKDIEESLIILPNVGFTDTMRLNAHSQRALKRFAQKRHHRMGTTWNP